MTAPEGTPDQQLDIWNARAMQIFNGGSGVLPPGTDVKTLTEARGQDPFSAYVEHQMESIVLLACGEKLTTLGGSTGLGSNLAEIQSQAFKDLVTYDCKRISNAITRCAVKKCVNKLFPNVDLLCKFTFVESDTVTPEKYIEMATALKNLGISLDVAKLKELTGLQFISDDQSDLWSPNPKTPEELSE